MASKYIAEVIAAAGNLDLAAERLRITRQMLVEELMSDEDISSAVPQLKMLLSISMFDVISTAQVALIASMSELSPYELSKTYSSFVDSFVRLTGVESEGAGSRVDSSMIKESILGKLVDIDVKRRDRAEAAKNEEVG